MINILCVIPARSGSKGLPHKNVKDYHGKPLLAWSIEQAQLCQYAMKIVVSTDSKEYADIAIKYGAEAPFLRPPEISGDLSTDYECMKHSVEWLKQNQQYYPDIVLQLRPTSPLRKVEDINQAVGLFLKNRENYDSLRSVVEFEKSPYKMYNIKENTLVPLFKKVDDINEPYNQCRQILPKCYLHNGYIDIFNTYILEDATISGERIYPYLMNKEDNLDIDEAKDWK